MTSFSDKYFRRRRRRCRRRFIFLFSIQFAANYFAYQQNVVRLPSHTLSLSLETVPSPRLCALIVVGLRSENCLLLLI